MKRFWAVLVVLVVVGVAVPALASPEAAAHASSGSPNNRISDAR